MKHPREHLRKQGLKTIIKPDNSPVTNGDLEVNKILTEKIESLIKQTNRQEEV